MFVGRSHNALCPVSAMLAFSGVREGMVEALFRFQDGQVLTRDCFVGHIREVLSKAGLDARNYAGHSFAVERRRQWHVGAYQMPQSNC